MFEITRRSLFRAASVLALVGATASTAQAIPLLNGFGGPHGYGNPANCVHPNDDGSYSGPPPTTGGAARAIDITPAFPNGINFFGMTHRAMYVNTNGNITFRGGVGTFTPQPFPVANQPMIAPWWADVDTRGGNPPTNNNICFHVERNRIIVTWNRVGYYSSHHNLLNDFQLVLSASNTCTTTADFDVEFRYNQCQWTTGDASGGTNGFGGTPAQVGFDAGNQRNFVSLPMSRMMSILDVCRTTNVPGAPPGLWRFQIRGGNVADGCMGGGLPCMVAGQRGICAAGVNICDGMATRCVQVNMPGPLRCNGFDDDCDGMPDEDDSLCPRGQICDRGNCVERCQSELGCLPGRTCTDRGACVETACLNMNCPDGQRCVGGMCVSLCDGFQCPHGQICRAGRCFDPCAGVVCDAREVCEPDPATGRGVCTAGCQCRPCAPGESCQPDGRCVPDTCVGVTCPTGTYCEEGRCRDACEVGPDSRLCPPGEVCDMGGCVPGVRRDGGVVGNDGGSRDAGGPRDAGFSTLPDGAMIPRDAGNSGGTDTGGVFWSPANRATCTCGNMVAPVSPRALVMGLAFGVVVVARRRSRSRNDSKR